MPFPLDPARPPPPLPDSWQLQARLARTLSRDTGWGTGMGTSVAVHVAAVASMLAGSWLWQAGPWVLIPPMHGTNSAASIEQQVLEVAAPRGAEFEDFETAVAVAAASLPSASDPQPAPIEISPVGTLPPPSATSVATAILEVDAAVPVAVTAERAAMASEPLEMPEDESLALARSVRRLSPSTLASADAAKAAPQATSASAASVSSRGAQSVPSPIFNPTPIYPAQLMAARVEGLVKLRVELDDGGRVVRAAVNKTSGYTAFDRAALDVIYRWRFTSSTASAPSQRTLVVPIRFGIVE